MENLNTSTNSQEETVMSNIQQLFHDFVNSGGDPKVTSFKRHLDKLINSEIKPLCGRSAKSADGTTWRDELKARFSGKGAKWVLVSLGEISPTITQLEDNGVDCDDYKTFTELKGAAWIRFSGPRLDSNNQQAAAFEVRTGGSKIDHPKQLHFIPLSVLDETIRPMEGTPHSLKFEVLAQPEVEEAEAPTEEPVETEAVSEVHPDNVITLGDDDAALEALEEEIEDDYEDVMDNLDDLMSFEDMDL